MIAACSALYPAGQYYKFRNFYYRFEHEADLFVISKSKYATEIEVKTSLSDWKADLSKSKHKDLKFLKNFYYAVPTELIDKRPEGIDPRYGLIEVYHSHLDGLLRASKIKSSENLGGGKLPKSITVRAFYRTYWRNLETESALRRIAEENRELSKQVLSLKGKD